MENKTQNRLPIVLKVYLYKNRPMKEIGSIEANPKILSLLAYDSITVQRIWERIIFLSKCAVYAALF